MRVLTIENKKDEKFLRKKTADFDFKKYKKQEIRELIKTMRQTMREAHGIGLSANQIGLDLNFFVAEIPTINVSQRVHQRQSATSKFYAVFNPKITRASKEKTNLEEGCLSVPNTYGMVERPEKITFGGFDQNAKKLKIKAWGLLARVLQHEVDHLNGILFVDKATNITKVEKSEEKISI
jgi:peptide deformylase